MRTGIDDDKSLQYCSTKIGEEITKFKEEMDFFIFLNSNIL